MYNMMLFIGFYGTAIARRDQPDVHERLMVLASASVLPAAIFRIIVGLTGFYWLATPGWVMPAVFFLPAVFIVIGIVYDRVAKGAVHRVYLVGLSVLLIVHGLGLTIAGTARVRPCRESWPYSPTCSGPSTECHDNLDTCLRYSCPWSTWHRRRVAAGRGISRADLDRLLTEVEALNESPA